MLRTWLLLTTLATLASSQALAMHHSRSLTAPAASPNLSLTSRGDAGLYAGVLAQGMSALASATLLALPTAGGKLVAQEMTSEPPPPPEVEPAAATLTAAQRAELQAEYAELEDNKPGLVFPIILTILGVVAIDVGYVMLTGATTQTLAFLGTAGLITVIAGVGVALLGGTLLLVAIVRRVGRTSRMNAIEEQLHPPRGSPAVAMGSRLEPQLVVARF